MNRRLGGKLGIAGCCGLALCFLLVQFAVAQLEVGKAVELSLNSGWSVKGRVLKISTDSVTLDVAPGAAAFTGTLTVASDSITSVRPIDELPLLKVTTPAPHPPKSAQEAPPPTPPPSPGKPSTEPERHELLKKFPPEDGWGKEKLENIKWRRVILGLFPSPEEKEFIEAFDAWEKAWEAEEKEKAILEEVKADKEEEGEGKKSEKEEGTEEPTQQAQP